MWLIALNQRRSRHVLTTVLDIHRSLWDNYIGQYLFILNFHDLMAYFDEVGGGLVVQFIIIVNLHDLGFTPSSGGHKADCI
jgi:hypothetical protein